MSISFSLQSELKFQMELKFNLFCVILIDIYSRLFLPPYNVLSPERNGGSDLVSRHNRPSRRAQMATNEAVPATNFFSLVAAADMYPSQDIARHIQ
jgi:hypothetical protein